MGKVRRRTQKKGSRRNKSVSSKRRSVSKLNKIRVNEPWAGNSNKKNRRKHTRKQSGGGWGSPKVYQPEMVGGWGGSENESNHNKEIKKNTEENTINK